MSDKTYSVKCYLTIKNLATDAQKSRGHHIPSVRRVTQNQPTLDAGEFAIKVELQVPQSMMEQPMPGVKIVIPDNFTQDLPDVYAQPVTLDLNKAK